MPHNVPQGLVRPEHALGCSRSSTGCGRLDRPISHDFLGELCLGLGEAGPCVTVLGVDLEKVAHKQREQGLIQVV